MQIIPENLRKIPSKSPKSLENTSDRPNLALSETNRTEFSAILCQKLLRKFGRSELGRSLIIYPAYIHGLYYN